MIRRPPRSTRTDTLFPYTTLFRSGCPETPKGSRHHTLPLVARVRAVTRAFSPLGSMQITERPMISRLGMMVPTPLPLRVVALVSRWAGPSLRRSDEQRAGKECVCTFRTWWSPVRYNTQLLHIIHNKHN